MWPLDARRRFAIAQLRGAMQCAHRACSTAAPPGAAEFLRFVDVAPTKPSPPGSRAGPDTLGSVHQRLCRSLDALDTVDRQLAMSASSITHSVAFSRALSETVADTLRYYMSCCLEPGAALGSNDPVLRLDRAALELSLANMQASFHARKVRKTAASDGGGCAVRVDPVLLKVAAAPSGRKMKPPRGDHARKTPRRLRPTSGGAASRPA